jgi:hypothetical protein
MDRLARLRQFEGGPVPHLDLGSGLHVDVGKGRDPESLARSDLERDLRDVRADDCAWNDTPQPVPDDIVLDVAGRA